MHNKLYLKQVTTFNPRYWRREVKVALTLTQSSADTVTLSRKLSVKMVGCITCLFEASLCTGEKRSNRISVC